MDLPHDPKPAGQGFRRVTEPVFLAARSLTHLEFRVLMTMYEMADYQRLTLTINRSELARRVGASRDKVNAAVRSIIAAGFVTLTNGADQGQMNPCPLTPQGSPDPSGGAPSGVRSWPLRGQGVDPQGSPSDPSGVTPHDSHIRNGREEEYKRDKKEKKLSSARDAREATARARTPEPEQPELSPLIAAIVAWGAGTIGHSAAARVAIVLDTLAREHPIPDAKAGTDADPQAVCLALIADMRTRPETPGPTQLARLRAYADSVLRACAAEGRMPGQHTRPVPKTKQTAAQRREEGNFEYDTDAALAMLVERH